MEGQVCIYYDWVHDNKIFFTQYINNQFNFIINKKTCTFLNGWKFILEQLVSIPEDKIIQSEKKKTNCMFSFCRFLQTIQQINKQNYKNTNKIIQMIETPQKALRKYQTIQNVEKNSKSNISTTAFRSKQRKSSSLLINPQIILNTTLPNIQNSSSLPKINEKRKQKKRGTFLQSWLDEALGSPDPFSTEKDNEDKVQGNILKTLKKFELDKRHLQSQNIPGEKIEKLYKSLYIYSYGVNKIFEEVLQLTRQSGNTELVGNFWKAYAKLLESCTSYQTVFQKIQKQHLQSIQRLKRNIETKSQSFQQQRKSLQQRIKKLQKSLQQKEMKCNNLQNQFDVLQNTLNLTDQAFNQQVNLRLKFEQKINAVYTSYEELKTKYTKLVEQMGIRNLDLMQKDNKQNQLKSKLMAQKTKVNQLIFLLNAERDKVQQRDTQIVIKVQQLQDAKMKVLAKQRQQDNTQDKMQEHLSRLKAVKMNLLETQTVVRGQKITIMQQQQQIKKLSKSLEQYKQLNNQVYEKYAVAGKKIVQHESKIQLQTIKIVDLEKAVMQKSAEITNSYRQLQHVKSQRDNLRHELNIAIKNLKDTSDTMTKNAQILEDIKAVKDKYQRINQYMKNDLKQLQKSHNSYMQQLSLKTQQMQGMKLLLQNRNKSIVQLQKQIQQQKQLYQIKATALNSVITKKQAIALQFQKSKQEADKKIQSFKSMLALAQNKCILLQSQILKLQIQLSSKTKLGEQLQHLLNKQNSKYKELNHKLQGQLKEKIDISSKLMTTAYVLKTKNQQQRFEVKTLQTLLNGYKAKILQKAQYVHPMLYQQALQISRRCYQNQQNAHKDVKKIKNQQSQLRNKLSNAEKLLQEKQAKIDSLLKDIEESKKKLQEQRNRMKQNFNKLEEKLKSMNHLYQKQQKANKKLGQNLIAKQEIQKNLNEKIKQLQNSIIDMTKQYSQLMAENRKRKNSRVQTRQIRTKKQTSEQGIQTLQEQNQSNKIEPAPIIAKQVINQQVQTQAQFQDHRLQSIQNQGLQPKYRQSRQQAVKKQPTPQKKVQNRQFKNALKLTYMRR